MQNERRAVHTGHGTRRLAAHVTFLVLASALVGCSGGSSSNSSSSKTLQSIALAPGDVTLPAGATQQFAVLGTYSDASTAPITTGIDWSSSNPSVATIAASGFATGTSDPTAAGTSTITASVSGLSAQASFTVTPPALDSITVEPANATLVELATQPFVAMGHYANGVNAPLAGVLWSCAPASACTPNHPSQIVDLDESFARGLHSGTVTITASARGKSSSAQLTIVHPDLQSITVSPGTSSVPQGLGRRFTAVGHMSNGTNEDNVAVTWSSSNTAVATVDPATGVATGVTQGETTITASHASGKTGNAQLTVAAPVIVTAPPNGTAQLPATGSLPFKVSGLTPGTEYLVRLSSNDNVPAERRPTVEVHPDATFAASWVCSSWAGGPPCRAGVPNASGEIFVLVSGNENATYALDVQPLPVVAKGSGPQGGSVDRTETYYKVTGLTPGAAFVHQLAPADAAVDLYAYDRAIDSTVPGLIGIGGPFGFAGYPPLPVPGFLCSTAASTGATKSCNGTIPLGGPTATYVTVEGWLTDAGSSFTLTP